jgi:phospholipase C
MPAVSFIKPGGQDDEHPSYANLLNGERHTADLIRAVMNSPQWNTTAIIITYDEVHPA